MLDPHGTVQGLQNAPHSGTTVIRGITNREPGLCFIDVLHLVDGLYRIYDIFDPASLKANR